MGRNRLDLMKSRRPIVLFSVLAFPFFLLGFGPSLSKNSPPPLGRQLRLNPDYGKLPLAFEPNQGQTDPQVKFLARGSGYVLFVTSQEVVLSLKNPQPLPNRLAHKGFAVPTPDPKPPTVLRLKLEGAQANPAFEPLEQLPGISNYFIGKDPAQWHANIPQYSKVAAHDVYPGVDMVYYGNQGRLEYDFQVKPGADPRAIHMKVEGAQGVQVNGQGDLELQTVQGRLVFRAPTVYQEAGEQKNTVEGRYKLEDGNRVGFEVKDYDRSKPLVIDPQLDYSSYLGGSSASSAEGVGVDGSENAYFTGFTLCTDFPTTNGAPQTQLKGTDDAVIVKINPAGTALLYSTYLGGSEQQAGDGIAVDPSGDAYVGGFTASTDFPTTSGVPQTNLNGTNNGFAAKLNSSGSLIYPTYLGGSGNGAVWAIAIDGSGEAYLTGWAGAGLTITTGAYQTTYAGTGGISYLTKLNASGTGVLYSTYLGATGQAYCKGIAVDGNGNAYLGGMANDPAFPTSPGAFQAAGLNGANDDGFVAKIIPAGKGSADLAYCTMLGGNDTDQIYGITVDNNLDAYVTGQTYSTNFPTTSGAFQTTYPSSQSAFVTKLNSTGTSLIYSTYLGSGGTFGSAITLDPNGDAYVTGMTGSGFPTTPGCYQPTYYGEPTEFNVFLTEFNPAGTALNYSTYLGGNTDDRGFGIALDSVGNVYLVGETESTNFPTTSGAPQTLLTGTEDAFVAKFDASAFFTPTPSPTSIISMTPTNSPTPTATSTFTASSTPTSANSSTGTFTPTLTSTGTIGPTRSPTETATPTASNSPTPTGTITPTATTPDTPTATISPAASSTSTSTNSTTPTGTATATYTDSPTATASPTPTGLSRFFPTDTPTPTPGSGVVFGLPYPNPVYGSGPATIPIQLPAGSTIEWSVFTTAFRKVLDTTSPVSGGSFNLVWNLQDQWQKPVASELYYLRVQVTGPVKATKILKIVVLR